MDKKGEATADTGESEAILHMLREGTPLMLGVVASGGGEGQDGGSVGGTGDDTGRRARRANRRGGSEESKGGNCAER